MIEMQSAGVQKLKHRGTLLLMLLEKHSEIHDFDFHDFL